MLYFLIQISYFPFKVVSFQDHFLVLSLLCLKLLSPRLEGSLIELFVLLKLLI